MIIDAHAHLLAEAWLPQWYWDFSHRSRARRFGITPEEARRRRIEAGGWDTSGDSVVRCMDAAGVDVSIICVVDWGLLEGAGEAEVPIEQVNLAYAEIVRRHPDRLVWAAGVDPRRPNAVQLVERAVREQGAKALKLYPPTGFYPNDRAIYPLYEKVVELNIPIIVHTGPTFGRLRSKYSDPIHLDDVAVDFPELSIIAVHAGEGYWQQMASIARYRTNIVCDLAAWQGWAMEPLMRFYENVRFLMQMLGPDRLLFASDSMGDNPAMLNAWVKAFTEIPREVTEAGIRFTQKELDAFLVGNAARVLHLESYVRSK